MTDLTTTIRSLMPAMQSRLAELVRVPSIAFDGYAPEPLLQAVQMVQKLLQSAGCADARVLDVGPHPAIYGTLPGPAGAPTVLLYAHCDVQPEGNKDEWSTSPFEPTVKDGRMYGRGAADDKGGIIMHLTALQAFNGKPPVNIKVIIESEEETGKHSLEEYMKQHPDLFAADVIIVGDVGNWKHRVPTLTTSLRGVTSVTVEVRTLKTSVHSGKFGGPTPDALVALLQMLATLHDEHGNVAVKGIVSQDWQGLDYPEADFHRSAGVIDGVDLVGDGSVSSRLWSKPSINVIGLDAPDVQSARNALVDVARARVSMRLPAGQDPQKAQDLLAEHLTSVTPWHSKVTVTRNEMGYGFNAQTDGPGYQSAKQALQTSYGEKALLAGSGGSIPLVNAFANTYPKAEIILWGVQDPTTNIHAPNESVDLQELERMALAEALFLQTLGTGSPQKISVPAQAGTDHAKGRSSDRR